MGKVTDRKKFKEGGRQRGFKKGRFSNWKDEGKTIGYLHPQIGIWERFPHGSIPTYEKNDKQEEVARGRRFNCQGSELKQIPHDACPVCVLAEFAVRKIEEGADKKEIILETGRGDDRRYLALKDIAGDGGYKRDPKAKREVAYVWIPASDKTPGSVKDAVVLHTDPQSVGDRMFDLFDSEVSDRGEVRGDPRVPAGWGIKLRKGELVVFDPDSDQVEEFNPYPVKLTYHEDADPGAMYQASKSDREMAPLTSIVQQAMLADASDLDFDLDALCEPADPETVLRAIKSSWCSRVVLPEEFEEFFRAKSGTKAEPRKKEDKPKADDKPKKKEPEKKADDKPAATGENVCRSCGHAMDPGTLFCPRCGTKAEKAAGGGGGDTPKDDEKKDDKPKGARAQCPDCQKEVDVMMPSCRCDECGLKLENVDVPF